MKAKLETKSSLKKKNPDVNLCCLGHKTRKILLENFFFLILNFQMRNYKLQSILILVVSHSMLIVVPSSVFYNRLTLENFKLNSLFDPQWLSFPIGYPISILSSYWLLRCYLCLFHWTRVYDLCTLSNSRIEPHHQWSYPLGPLSCWIIWCWYLGTLNLMTFVFQLKRFLSINLSV